MLIKICGVTTVADAVACADLGADAIGLNFWDRSVRRCGLEEAARIAAVLRERVRLVGVFVDAEPALIAHARSIGIEWAQLHGEESDEVRVSLAPRAYKAVKIGSEADLERALLYGGEELLIDANVAGKAGGTGERVDVSLAARAARARKIWLAGGLRPENVADAIRDVAPYGVDVASGVERAPGLKDLARVEAFIRAADPDRKGVLAPTE
jgi:phosphoribosylanthranilate isomerase